MVICWSLCGSWPWPVLHTRIGVHFQRRPGRNPAWLCAHQQRDRLRELGGAEQFEHRRTAIWRPVRAPCPRIFFPSPYSLRTSLGASAAVVVTTRSGAQHRVTPPPTRSDAATPTSCTSSRRPVLQLRRRPLCRSLQLLRRRRRLLVCRRPPWIWRHHLRRRRRLLQSGRSSACLQIPALVQPTHAHWRSPPTAARAQPSWAMPPSAAWLTARTGRC